MYYNKKIPLPFQNRTQPAKPISTAIPVPIEAKESGSEKHSVKQKDLSPLVALLLLDIFSEQKKDG